MHDAVDYLFNLSDPELLLYWQAFGEFPTHDRRQRRRLAGLVGKAMADDTPRPLNLLDRQRIGDVKVIPAATKVSA